MELTVLLLLTSGLFLGWSLGAADSANVFGTAVGSGMVRFVTAASVCSIFVILGAVFSGAGAAGTLGRLGSVNALPGSFITALSAAFTVYSMAKLRLPVSTTQAIVGAIIGWNLFSGSATDTATLATIVTTWVFCPVAAGLFASLIYLLVRRCVNSYRIHVLSLDLYTRIGLILAGAFGSYSLGANNIGNVMGVFVEVSPFTGFEFSNGLGLTSVQQLFLLGAVAIAVGVFTYSKRVMLTVGNDLMPLSPIAAWVVVVAHSLVLFLFASEALEAWLASQGLPTIPLVPVSSSQAIVGAVVGLGLVRGGREVEWRLVGNIALGWVTTPLASAVLCFIGLYVFQNVFDQQVHRLVEYRIDAPVLKKMQSEFGFNARLAQLEDRDFYSARELLGALKRNTFITDRAELRLLDLSESGPYRVRSEHLYGVERVIRDPERLAALAAIEGRRFVHKWQLQEALARQVPQWRLHRDGIVSKHYNKELVRELNFLYRRLRPRP